ncbi:hypothetical protein ABPG77_006028 [Micractinium sp. CCAP 211/92]
MLASALLVLRISPAPIPPIHDLWCELHRRWAAVEPGGAAAAVSRLLEETPGPGRPITPRWIATSSPECPASATVPYPPARFSHATRAAPSPLALLGSGRAASKPGLPKSGNERPTELHSLEVSSVSPSRRCCCHPAAALYWHVPALAAVGNNNARRTCRAVIPCSPAAF